MPTGTFPQARRLLQTNLRAAPAGSFPEVMYSLPYNGRAPLLGSAPMNRTFRFAAVFAAALTLAGALSGAATAQQRPDPYTVRDITFDKVSTVSYQDAIAQGSAERKLAGAVR